MSYHDSGNAYIEALTRKGYREIAAGLYSTVMAKGKSNRVIKVFRYQTGDFDGWAEYVHWATQMGFAGTYAPKVYSFKRHEGFYVAVMERLDSTISKIERSNKAFDFYWHWRDESWTKEYPAFHEFMVAFQKRFSDYSLDMHDDNWMVRGDNIVLTDPISGHYSTDKVPKRWRAFSSSRNQLALPGI